MKPSERIHQIYNERFPDGQGMRSRQVEAILAYLDENACAIGLHEWVKGGLMASIRTWRDDRCSKCGVERRVCLG